MWQNAREAYVESRILSAGPVELVRLLYQGAAGAVRDARRHLASGEIRERSCSISKAWEILTELAESLDYARGGEISGRLAQLYDYMRRRLTEAHLRQDDRALAEVQELLGTLAEAWDGVSAPEPGRAAGGRGHGAWAQPACQEAVEAGCSHGWSL
ncbi:MAG TPA: flagellar export chaperone FliS [Bryobacteraceae bacterium]|nr:flagellar export chaperone FliS [Bryobacteraceae bacterium]